MKQDIQPTKKKWSKDEEEFIRNNLSSMTISDFSEHFNVPKPKIIDKIHKMGLNSRKALGIEWSSDEDNLLRQHFEYAPKDFIMKLFPNRSWDAIYQRGLKTLKLNRISQDRYSINYNFFENWNSNSAYVFGLLLTDGHIHRGDKNYVQIELQKDDEEILQKIKEAMEYDGEIFGTDTTRFQCANVKIIEDLISKGMPPIDKTFTTKWPESLPKEFYPDFMRGAIDGDGWITNTSDGRFHLGFCGNYELVKDMKEHLPIDCSDISIIHKSEHCWSFKVDGKRGLKIADWLYNNNPKLFLRRKYNAYLQYKYEYCKKNGINFSVHTEMQVGHGLKPSNS